MKTNVSEYDFCRAFETSDTYKDQFTHSAQKALYEYLTELEDELREEMELDVVALCCEYTEYKSAVEAVENYNFQYSDHGLSKDEDSLTDEEREQEALDFLGDHTQVLVFDGTLHLSDGTIIGNSGVIVQNF